MIIIFALFLIFGTLFAILLSTVKFFTDNVIYFDCILIGIVTGVCCKQFLSLHTVFCIVIGFLVFGLLCYLHTTKYGFFIIGGLFTILYSCVFGIIVMEITDHDWLWGVFVFLVSLFWVGGLHIKAKADILSIIDKNTNNT